MAGFFYTDEELAVWRNRAQNGPFKSEGDAFTYSPNDWERIVQNADTFLSNPSAVYWDGPDMSTGRIEKKPVSQSVGWSWYASRNMMCAAFVDLVNNTSVYKSAIKDVMIYEANRPNLDFSNATLYPNGHVSDHAWELAEWHARFLRSYDFIGRNYFSASEQNVLDAWFLEGALWTYRECNNALQSKFNNTRGVTLDNYSVKYPFNTPVGQWTEPYWVYATSSGSVHNVAPIQAEYNNRRCAQEVFIAMTGIWLNNTTLINEAIYYVQESLAFYIYEDGSFTEMYRSYYDGVEGGLNYAANTFYGMLEISHLLYVGGKENLFTYSTRAGVNGTESTNTDKSLEWATLELMKYVDGVYTRYVHNRPQTPEYIQAYYHNNSIRYILAAITMDIYYSTDNALRNKYMPSAYPQYPQSNGPYQIYEGWAGNLPGILFMYADIQGQDPPTPAYKPSVQIFENHDVKNSIF